MSKLSSTKIQSISMIVIAKEAIDFTLGNKQKIINSIKYPSGLTILLSLSLNPEQEKIDLFWAVSSIFQVYLYILVVVRLHRIFLLNEEEHSLRGSFVWQSNNTSYLLTTIALLVLATFFITPTVLFLPSSLGNSQAYTIIFMAIILMPVGYLLSRFSLVLPSIAINDKIDFGESWNISKGNGCKVFILVMISPIIFNTIIDLIYYDNIALRPLYSLCGIFSLVLEVIILSATYKTIRQIKGSAGVGPS